MTTGTRLVGSASIAYFYYRYWSGADGAVLSYYRTVRPAHYQLVYGLKSYKVGKKTYKTVTVTRMKFVPARVFQHTRRSHSQWNSYTMDTIVSNRTKNLNGTWNPDWVGNTYPIWVSNNGIVKAQNKFTQKFRTHSFNLGVTAAEFPKVMSLCVSTVQRVARSVNSLRKGNLADAARHLGTSHRGPDRVKPLDSSDLSERWLELQYGWKPLLSDVHDAAHAAAFHANPPRTSRYRAGVKETYAQSNVVPDSINAFADGETYYAMVYETREQLSSARSLGLTNPAAVAWELMPFSFVIDWFIPIGAYLDNLNVAPQVSGRYYTTRMCQVKATYSRIDLLYGGGGRNETSRVQLIRDVTSGYYPTKPTFEMPKASATHFWNTLALARQVLVPK